MPAFAKKKYFRLAKGFYGRSKNCIRICAPRVEKALQYSYRDRKVRPRLLRQTWIRSINSAVAEHGINYSRFIYCLNHSNLDLNRKILAELAKNEPYSFKAVVDEIKIQGLYETKQKNDVNYLDALGSGLLIGGKILQKSYPEYEDKYHGYPGWDKMTPEQKLKAMKQ